MSREMDNYAYPVSYPESGDSSPRSREIDFDHTTPWDDQTAPPGNYKVKFMCSYGGKIHPRPHDNHLSYIGGETKILAVDRTIKFPSLIAKLLALCDAVDVSFKYQLPGEDLDALISVTNDEDLEHMMHEYDRLCKASSKPARLRLFLFPVAAGEGSFGSSEGRSDRDRFVDALNTGPIQSQVPAVAAAEPAHPPPANNVDFLFGLEKRIHVPPPLQQQQAAAVATKVHVPEILATPQDRVIGPDNSMLQSQIQDLQRLQISSAQEQAAYRRRSEESLVEAFAGDNYAQRVSPPAPVPVSAPTSYWQEKPPAPAGGFYQATAPFPEQQQQQQQAQQVYMIPTPTGMYHAPMGRQMTGPAGQGYYAVQRMPTEVYREHQSPVYNAVPPSQAVAQPNLPPSKVAGFTTAAGGAGVVDAGYGAQVAYDNATGRQVYYAAQGGAMTPQAYQAMAAAAAVNGEMRAPGGLMNQEGKVIVKTSQPAV